MARIIAPQQGQSAASSAGGCRPVFLHHLSRKAVQDGRSSAPGAAAVGFAGGIADEGADYRSERDARIEIEIDAFAKEWVEPVRRAQALLAEIARQEKEDADSPSGQAADTSAAVAASSARRATVIHPSTEERVENDDSEAQLDEEWTPSANALQTIDAATVLDENGSWDGDAEEKEPIERGDGQHEAEATQPKRLWGNALKAGNTLKAGNAFVKATGEKNDAPKAEVVNLRIPDKEPVLRMFKAGQASTKKMESIIEKFEHNTRTGRYMNLARDLEHPHYVVGKLEEMIDGKFLVSMEGFRLNLFPTVKALHTWRYELEELSQRESDNDAVGNFILERSDRGAELQKEYQELVSRSVDTITVAVARAQHEYDEASQELAHDQAELTHLTEKYAIWDNEMSALSRRQGKDMHVVNEFMAKKAAIEKMQKEEEYKLQVQLQSLARAKRQGVRQLTEMNNKVRELWSRIEAKVQRRFEAQSEEVLKIARARIEKERQFQARALTHRAGLLEHEIKTLKGDLARQQRLLADAYAVNEVLALRLYVLEAKGILVLLRPYVRELAKDGSIAGAPTGRRSSLTHEANPMEQRRNSRDMTLASDELTRPEDLPSGVLLALAGEVEAQRNWLAVRGQPWELKPGTFTIVNQPAVSTPMSFVRSFRLHAELENNSRRSSVQATKESENEVEKGAQPDTTNRVGWKKVRAINTVCKMLASGKSLARLAGDDVGANAPPAASTGRRGASLGLMPGLDLARKDRSGKRNRLEKLAGIEVTEKSIGKLLGRWVAWRERNKPFGLEIFPKLEEQTEALLEDVASGVETARICAFWFNQGAWGIGALSDLLDREVSWLPALAETLEERCGVLRACLDCLEDGEEDDEGNDEPDLPPTSAKVPAPDGARTGDAAGSAVADDPNATQASSDPGGEAQHDDVTEGGGTLYRRRQATITSRFSEGQQIRMEAKRNRIQRNAQAVCEVLSDTPQVVTTSLVQQAQKWLSRLEQSLQKKVRLQQVYERAFEQYTTLAKQGEQAPSAATSRGLTSLSNITKDPEVIEYSTHATIWELSESIEAALAKALKDSDPEAYHAAVLALSWLDAKEDPSNQDRLSEDADVADFGEAFNDSQLEPLAEESHEDTLQHEEGEEEASFHSEGSGGYNDNREDEAQGLPTLTEDAEVHVSDFEAHDSKKRRRPSQAVDSLITAEDVATLLSQQASSPSSPSSPSSRPRSISSVSPLHRQRSSSSASVTEPMSPLSKHAPKMKFEHRSSSTSEASVGKGVGLRRQNSGATGRASTTSSRGSTHMLAKVGIARKAANQIKQNVSSRRISRKARSMSNIEGFAAESFSESRRGTLRDSGLGGEASSSPPPGFAEEVGEPLEPLEEGDEGTLSFAAKDIALSRDRTRSMDTADAEVEASFEAQEAGDEIGAKADVSRASSSEAAEVSRSPSLKQASIASAGASRSSSLKPASPTSADVSRSSSLRQSRSSSLKPTSSSYAEVFVEEMDARASAILTPRGEPAPSAESPARGSEETPQMRSEEGTPSSATPQGEDLLATCSRHPLEEAVANDPRTSSPELARMQDDGAGLSHLSRRSSQSLQAAETLALEESATEPMTMEESVASETFSAEESEADNHGRAATGLEKEETDEAVPEEGVNELGRVSQKRVLIEIPVPEVEDYTPLAIVVHEVIKACFKRVASQAVWTSQADSSRQRRRRKSARERGTQHPTLVDQLSKDARVAARSPASSKRSSRRNLHQDGSQYWSSSGDDTGMQLSLGHGQVKTSSKRTSGSSSRPVARATETDLHGLAGSTQRGSIEATSSVSHASFFNATVLHHDPERPTVYAFAPTSIVRGSSSSPRTSLLDSRRTAQYDSEGPLADSQTLAALDLHVEGHRWSTAPTKRYTEPPRLAALDLQLLDQTSRTSADLATARWIEALGGKQDKREPRRSTLALGQKPDLKRWSKLELHSNGTGRALIEDTSYYTEKGQFGGDVEDEILRSDATKFYEFMHGGDAGDHDTVPDKAAEQNSEQLLLKIASAVVTRVERPSVMNILAMVPVETLPAEGDEQDEPACSTESRKLVDEVSSEGHVHLIGEPAGSSTKLALLPASGGRQGPSTVPAGSTEPGSSRNSTRFQSESRGTTAMGSFLPQEGHRPSTVPDSTSKTSGKRISFRPEEQEQRPSTVPTNIEQLGRRRSTAKRPSTVPDHSSEAERPSTVPATIEQTSRRRTLVTREQLERPSTWRAMDRPSGGRAKEEPAALPANTEQDGLRETGAKHAGDVQQRGIGKPTTPRVQEKFHAVGQATDGHTSGTSVGGAGKHIRENAAGLLPGEAGGYTECLAPLKKAGVLPDYIEELFMRPSAVRETCPAAGGPEIPLHDSALTMAASTAQVTAALGHSAALVLPSGRICGLPGSRARSLGPWHAGAAPADAATSRSVHGGSVLGSVASDQTAISTHQVLKAAPQMRAVPSVPGCADMKAAARAKHFTSPRATTKVGGASGTIGVKASLLPAVNTARRIGDGRGT